MNLLIVAPVTLALLGMVAGWFLPRYLRPKAATQVLTAAVVVTTAAIVSALVQVAVAGASEVPVVADVFGWCRALYHGQHGAAPAVGLLAGAALGFMAVAGVRHRHRIRRDLAVFSGVDGVEVVALEGPIAFAVPGRRGGVVLGQGLLEHLDGEQRCAVLAHENAHLALHHHRYVNTVELCAAAVPALRPLASQVRFQTERWADEVAADRIGSRRVLAGTIARVALMPSGTFATGAQGFRTHRTVERVDALLNPRSPSAPVAVGGAAAVLGVVGFGSAMQLHHLAEFVAHICPV
jgi:Zn-dependent protease with chaperone function